MKKINILLERIKYLSDIHKIDILKKELKSFDGTQLKILQFVFKNINNRIKEKYKIKEYEVPIEGNYEFILFLKYLYDFEDEKSKSLLDILQDFKITDDYTQWKLEKEFRMLKNI